MTLFKPSSKAASTEASKACKEELQGAGLH